MDHLPILIVDDNASNRQIVAELLENWRIKTVAVADTKSALHELSRATAAGHPYRLILLDALLAGEDGFTLANQMRDRSGPNVELIMMLPSADCAGDVARCQELGIAHYLTKPISQFELFDAVAYAVIPQPRLQSAAAADSTSPEIPVRRPLRVLLAEDNPVNRELAVALLRTLGHQASIAADGYAVLAALEKSTFDVVLMDLQMPKLDGLKTAREIRRREQAQTAASSPNARRLPIIAVTAHAMQSDRASCLAAGMDGYVIKPVRRKDLLAALDQLFPPALSTNPSAPSPSEPVFDQAKLLEEMGGNTALLKRLAAVYFEHTPVLLQIIQAAVASGQMMEIQKAAHTLKGSLTQFAAFGVAQHVARVEEAARNADPATARLAAELAGQVEQFDGALRQFLNTIAS